MSGMSSPRSLILAITLAASLLAACAKVDIPTEFPTPEPPPPATPIPHMEYKRDTELEKQFETIAQAAKGKVGAAAVVLETGDAAFLNADGHYPMQSVYKLPIAMAMMDSIRRGEHALDEKVGVTPADYVRQGQASMLRDKNPNGGEFTIRELIRLTLVESDGSASDILLRTLGGPQEVQSYIDQIGISDMHVLNTEKELGANWQTQYENWATPIAGVELLRWLDSSVGGWRPPNLDEDLAGGRIILQEMMECNTGPNRIKGSLPNSYPRTVAHKTGTGGTQNGITSATNDIGLIYSVDKRIAVAVFVSDSPADEKTREAVIAKIAKAAFDRWGK